MIPKAPLRESLHMQIVEFSGPPKPQKYNIKKQEALRDIQTDAYHRTAFYVGTVVLAA